MPQTRLDYLQKGSISDVRAARASGCSLDEWDPHRGVLAKARRCGLDITTKGATLLGSSCVEDFPPVPLKELTVRDVPRVLGNKKWPPIQRVVLLSIAELFP